MSGNYFLRETLAAKICNVSLTALQKDECQDFHPAQIFHNYYSCSWLFKKQWISVFVWWTTKSPVIKHHWEDRHNLLCRALPAQVLKAFLPNVPAVQVMPASFSFCAMLPLLTEGKHGLKIVAQPFGDKLWSELQGGVWSSLRFSIRKFVSYTVKTTCFAG